MTQYLPDWLNQAMITWLSWLPDAQRYLWLDVVLQVALILVIVVLGDRFGVPILQRLARHFPFSRRLLVQCRRALRVSVFFLLLQVVFRDSESILRISPLLLHLTALLTIVSLTWLSTRVLARSINVLIIVIGTGMALMTLPALRQIGTSLLASAGVAGLVVGLAAKPVLGNLLAGLQLAISQPIRLDDVVIVENEWGQIEEITGTYVVVRIWDQRRLIVPLQWFIEHPFQNWTRSNAELLGSVMLWVDFRLPMEPLRVEAQRLCSSLQEWDGRVCVVQVTDTNEHGMQIRILVSAADSPRAFDLRCKVREGLLDFVQRHYPDCLPLRRTETTTVTSNSNSSDSAR